MRWHGTIVNFDTSRFSGTCAWTQSCSIPCHDNDNDIVKNKNEFPRAQILSARLSKKLPTSQALNCSKLL